MRPIRSFAKRAVNGAIAVARRTVPLPARLALVAWLGSHALGRERLWMSIGLLRDYAERDPSACHRFLWSHHLAYAETYEVERKFGADNVPRTRLMLFDDLRRFLEGVGINPATAIRSVFEVGCSLGYLLLYLESGLFTSASSLEGIDIDGYAIAQGASYLAGIGSKVQVMLSDMGQLDAVLGDRTFDVILCVGTLMYLRYDDALDVVRTILNHAGTLAVFSGPAHPDRDNATLESSAVRARDATFIHNLDGMVQAAGGEVVWRRWEGPREVDGKTIYFVFARPLAAGQSASTIALPVAARGLQSGL